MTSKFTAPLYLLSMLVIFGGSCQIPVEVEPAPIPAPAGILVKKLQARETDFYNYT